MKNIYYFVHKTLKNSEFLERTTTLSDTIGGQILPLDRYSVVAVLMDPNTPQIMLDVKQIKLQN